jgi:hypothetical protein
MHSSYFARSGLSIFNLIMMDFIEQLSPCLGTIHLYNNRELGLLEHWHRTTPPSRHASFDSSASGHVSRLLGAEKMMESSWSPSWEPYPHSLRMMIQEHSASRLVLLGGGGFYFSPELMPHIIFCAAWFLENCHGCKCDGKSALFCLSSNLVY